MATLQRNQLVWLHDAAWPAVQAQAWDAQAHDLLAYWQAQQLPLVVCRQRPGVDATQFSLGLAAPLQWQRRKLGLDVAPQAIADTGSFPLLRRIPMAAADQAQIDALLCHTDALQVPLHVHGSYGWQALCELPCVRESSDLDLLAHVPDLDTAAQVVWLLQGLQLQPRVDGELVFPGGWAIAWREYAQLIGGRVEQVLVKERTALQLMDMAQLRQRFRAHPPAHQSAPHRRVAMAC